MNNFEYWINVCFYLICHAWVVLWIHMDSKWQLWKYGLFFHYSVVRLLQSWMETICVNIKDEVFSPLWTIGIVPGQNLYGRQAVAYASHHPHSTALTKSKGTGILLLFGASLVAGDLPPDLSLGFTPVNECSARQRRFGIRVL